MDAVCDFCGDDKAISFAYHIFIYCHAILFIENTVHICIRFDVEQIDGAAQFNGSKVKIVSLNFVLANTIDFSWFDAVSL